MEPLGRFTRTGPGPMEPLDWFTRTGSGFNPQFLGHGSAVRAGSEPVANGSGSGSKRFGNGSVPGNLLRGHP